ncbi:MAG: tetratricopeptide repeat protein [Acidobacteria bacterium]|nr:tetratricopeptide repeat protein [Acidobacteriota bacterium]
MLTLVLLASFFTQQTASAAGSAPPAIAAQGFADSRGGLKAPALPATGPQALGPEMRGDIFMARKMYREAAEMYKQMDPSSAITWNKVGIAYHQMLDLDAAKRYYERAAKINPKYPEAVNNLGTIHYAKKNYRRAVSSYRRALRLTPDSASILSNLGTAYFARKSYDEAFKAYQQALALDPEVFEHRGAAGVMLQERTVEERAKFHFYLAKTYAKSGNSERALMYLRKALEEGFKERDRMNDDPSFAAMRELPEFQELLQYKPKVL